MVEPSSTSKAITILRGAGIVVTEGTASDWTLRLPDGTYNRVNLKAFRRNPPLSWIRHEQTTDQGRRVLLIVDTESSQLEDYARQNILDVVNVQSGFVIINGREWASPVQTETPQRSPKPAWGRWGVMRALYISQRPRTQAELVGYVGVSQPAVSFILRDLPNVNHDERGWQSTDKRHLLDSWREAYPGPGGTSTYWYGLTSIAQQADDAAQVARELQIKHLSTGDTAADEYAPWRLPARAHLYLDEIVDFSVMNLTPAEPEDATLVATVPDDPTIWHTAYLQSPAPYAVDPLIMFWDVLHSLGSDAEEAAMKVLEAIPV